MAKLVYPSLWFQALWFLAVLGQEPWQWAMVTLATVTYAFCLIKKPFPIEKAIGLALFGLLLDYCNMQTGILMFDSPYLPIWLIALWFSFTWYAYILKSFLSRYPLLLVSMIGGVAGALSYFAGEKLSAVTFAYPLPLTLGVLFIEWTLFMMLIAKVYGYGKSSTTGVVS